MAKAEWGEKRQCPKCGTRFYDLGEFEPITCISCEHQFQPEIILKSKTHSIELITDKKEAEAEDEEADLLDDDALLSDDDDTNVAAVVDAPNVKPTTDD